MYKLALATLVSAVAFAAVPAPANAQYHHDGGRAQVTCASHNGRYHSCRLPYRGNVRLVRQLSDRPCVRGRTWGEKSNSRVWVSRGCRATFAVRSDRRHYDDRRTGDTWTRDRNYGVTCRANGTRTTCAWDTRYGNPYLLQTTSGTCVEGRDWGYDRSGRIWVTSYCNARFGQRF